MSTEPTQPKLTVVGNKLTITGITTEDITDRILDCKGAVTLAISGILSQDEEEISAATGALCIVARELQRLSDEIGLSDFATAADKAPAAAGWIMYRESDCFASDAPVIADHLQKRWPGVRINRMHLHHDDRRDESEFAGQLAISLNVAGESSDLLAIGIIQQADLDSLPPCGVGRRRGRNIMRSKKGRIRVEVLVLDPPNDYVHKDGSDAELFNLLAAVVAPAIWSPPTEAA